jgi:hypothetical protein
MAERDRLRAIWREMRRRCSDPTNSHYAHYGGRGIKVCPAWAGDFEVFYTWARAAGYGPGLTLDRKDNDGDYAPANCRWATRAQQNLNYRRNVHLTAFGETKTIKEWAADPRCAVSEAALRLRVRRRGWDAELALTTPTIHNSAEATHCPQGHPYSPENTYRDENGWRKCATCVKARVKRWREFRKEMAAKPF